MNKLHDNGLKISRQLATPKSLVDTVDKMFTGIIMATGHIIENKRAQNSLALTIELPQGWNDVAVGESIAINGVCLTVTAIAKQNYQVLLVPETLAKTTFGKNVPSSVNLERALSVGDRLGGHFVQGHIDTTAVVSGIDESDGYKMEVTFLETFRQFVILKGSIALDGVALTVAAVSSNTLTVVLIPHTLEHTTLHNLKQGDVVNLEFDMWGKYVINFMEVSHATSQAS